MLNTNSVKISFQGMGFSNSMSNNGEMHWEISIGESASLSSTGNTRYLQFKLAEMQLYWGLGPFHT